MHVKIFVKTFQKCFIDHADAKTLILSHRWLYLVSAPWASEPWFGFFFGK